jgi:CMP-N-acetylneuraminic acid synthetase
LVWSRARGGSKRIRRKNILPLMGKPLLAYTAESALRACLFSCVVSTEDEEVAEIGRQCDYFGEVEGQTTYSCTLADGRHVHGHDFLQGQWTWRDHT